LVLVLAARNDGGHRRGRAVRGHGALGQAGVLLGLLAHLFVALFFAHGVLLGDVLDRDGSDSAPAPVPPLYGLCKPMKVASWGVAMAPPAVRAPPCGSR